MDIRHTDVFSSPLLQLFFYHGHGPGHIGHCDVHSHHIAGAAHLQVDGVQAAVSGLLQPEGQEVAVNRHNAYADIPALCHCHQMADLLHPLDILGDDDPPHLML